MNKLGTKLGAIAMSAVMALSFAPSAAITSLAAEGDDLISAEELSVPVYRLYNPNSGEHLFTTNANECDSLDKGGWDYEGIEWYAPTEGDQVYRLYNPNHPLGDHHYTASQSEVDNLVKEGWKLDKNAFYTAAADDLVRDEVISLYNPNAYALGQATHHLTLKEDEAADLVALGWVNEGVKFYGYAEDLDPEVEELTVSIDNTTPKVGDTLTAITVPADAVVTYQWYSGTDATSVTNPILGETDDELTVTASMLGQYLKVVVTDLDGDTAESDVTDAVTTNELALKSVEGAAINEDNGTYNVVIAYFNQPVDGITAGDIQIRQVSNDQLFSVDSVSLSSDGMTATITLANSNAAGASVVGLDQLVDYNMIVTKDGSTASKVFYIPATLSNQTVVATDADKGTITIGYAYTTNAGAYLTQNNGELTIPEELTVDYADLLGRTVSVKFDKNWEIKSLNVNADETVIYGAFKGSTANKNLTNVITKESYKVQTTSAGTIRPSAEIHKTAAGWSGALAQLTDAAMDSDTEGFLYGKMVLNSNKTIKVFVNDPKAAKWDQVMLITSIKNNTLLAGTTEQNIKDYTILCDGYTMDIDDIEEGDVVFVDTANKLAIVYNNSETRELEAVYHDKFTFGGTTYDVTHTDDAVMLNSEVYYNKEGGARTAVDDDYLNALVAGGEDVTVYFGMNGQPVYLMGEVGETVTTTETLVLTANSKFYTEKLSNYFRVKGFNGEETVTHDIDLSKLEFIVVENGDTYKKGYTNYAKGTANPATNDNYKGFEVGSVAITTAGAGSITQDGNAGAGDLITDATLGKKALITLTKNDKDQIIGINFEDIAAGTGDALADGKDFKSGLKVVNGLQLDGSAPVYIYQVDGSKANTVTVRDYSDFNGVVAKANEAKVHVYSSNDKDVSAIVIESDGLSGDTSGQTVEEVVVKSYKKTTESTPKLAELTVIYQGEEYTYTEFSSDAKGVTPVAGDIYTLTINKDGETVDGLAIVTDLHRTTIDVTSVDSQEFTLDPTNLNLTKRKLATTVEPTIVKFEDGAYVPGTFADLQDADVDTTSPKQINWSWLAGSTDYVDTIVVTGTTATALATAKAAELTKIQTVGTAVNLNATLSSDTSSTFDVSNYVAAGVDFAGAGATATSNDFTAGTVTLAGAASTLATTGAQAGDTATITITTALGNNITITLTTEAARAASLSETSLAHAMTANDDDVIGTVNILDQYGDVIVNAATTVVYTDAGLTNVTTKIDGTANAGTITFAQNGATPPEATTYAKVTAADGTTELGTVTITLAN